MGMRQGKGADLLIVAIGILCVMMIVVMVMVMVMVMAMMVMVCMILFKPICNPPVFALGDKSVQ